MEKQDKTIIIKYLNGECSKSENKQIEEWIAFSPENLRLFQDYQKIWIETRKLSPKFGTIDIEKELDHYLSKIQTENVPATIFAETSPGYSFGWRKLWTNSWVKYAAIVFLAVNLGLAGYWISTDRNPANRYTEITVPNGSKTQISLPDGTVVWLNAGSKLRYEKNFNHKTREVFLEGEGYFIVAKDPSRPFLVQASNLSIRAIGTEFNVKCYPGEGAIETTLVEGVVKVMEKNKAKGTSNDVVLKPNQKLTFIKKTGKLFLGDDLKETVEKENEQISEEEAITKERKEQVIVKTIDPKPVIAWKEDKLILTGERFEEVKVKLERWYDVTVQIEDPEILDLRFKGTFEKESIAQALEALRLASPFHYKVDKKNIIITK